MFKVILCVLVAAVSGYSATISACGDLRCQTSFVNDTLLDSSAAVRPEFTFVKDAGEILGVAAVKLQLNNAQEIPWFLGEFNFRWAQGNANSGRSNSEYDGVNGFHYISSIDLLTNCMSVSHAGPDTLAFWAHMYFYPRNEMTDSLLPAVGDTLNWQLSFIYFHGSKVDIGRWINWIDSSRGVPNTISWEGSDTVTVRYRTIMRDTRISVGLPKGMTPQPEAKAVGLYDLQGRPLDAGASPSGLVFERTTQGFRKRLQLR